MLAAAVVPTAKLIANCAPWNVVCKIGEKVTEAVRRGFEGLMSIVYGFVTDIITEAVKVVVNAPAAAAP